MYYILLILRFKNSMDYAFLKIGNEIVTKYNYAENIQII